MEDMYMPEPPDLEKLNMTLVEWMEEAARRLSANAIKGGSIRPIHLT